MVLYSHSRLSTFEQCQLKYKFKYVDELTPDYENSIEAFLGKKIHETLEWMYTRKDEQNITLDDAVAFYIAAWNRDFSDNIKIVKEEFSKEYYFNKGIRFLINYFMKNHPFSDNTIATEKKIFITLGEAKQYTVIGFIDRLVHHTHTNIFEIHDYKTGAIKSQEELDRDRQLALYSIAIRESFPTPRDVHLIWHFLDYGEKKMSIRTYSQLHQLKEEIVSLIKTIEQSRAFLPNPSVLCKWCEFRSYCPVIKEHPDFPEIHKPFKITDFR